MKKLLLFGFILIIATSLFAEKKYWYMRKDGSCFMVSKEKQEVKGKIEFYQEKKPTKKQVKAYLNKQKLKEKTLTETDIEKVIEKYLNSDKGKKKIKQIIQDNTI